MNQPKPALDRRYLTQRLQELRKERNLTQHEVAKALDWSQSKVQRIEAGLSSISTSDLSYLLGHYKVPQDSTEYQTLQDSARSARARSELTTFRDVANRDYLAYLEHEEIASRLLQFEPLLVPGILQTDRYTRTSLRGFAAFDDSTEQGLDARIERKRELREVRQRRLLEGHLAAAFLLDESVLRRAVGAEAGQPEIMIEQLEHLRDLAQLPNIKIGVLPFSLGTHIGMLGAFALLELPGATEPFLYSENAFGDIATKERPKQAEERLRAFLDLQSKALHGAGFTAAIEEAVSRLR